MSSKTIVDQYQKRYIDLSFERGGLFELVQERFHPVQVLYPGCSVHITPAFFFPHVVFVDQDPDARAFFADHEFVLALVKRRRKYRRTPYIQFIAQDFTRPLPIPRGQFDLVLALYAGGISKVCPVYLKRGGILVTNNHHNDALEAAQDDELDLIAVAERRQGHYRLRDAEPGESLRSNPTGRPRRYLRPSQNGVEYIDNESYYVFRKIHPLQARE